MLDPETFLTELYVHGDTFGKAHLPATTRSGPAAALSPSEVVTLAIFGQWTRFASEAAFYRHVHKHLRPLFPTLPSRAQVNRAVRTHHDPIVAVARHLGAELAAGDRAVEVVDGTGLPTRNAKRRGAGWLWGQADIGRWTRLGWSDGMKGSASWWRSRRREPSPAGGSGRTPQRLRLAQPHARPRYPVPRQSDRLVTP